MMKFRCARCGEVYLAESSVGGHGLEECLKFVLRERDELREYIMREGPEHLRTELASLRSVIVRTEVERKLAVDALSRTQARCTELLEEVRTLKSQFDVGAITL